MKRLIAVAGMAALAACSQPATEEAEEAAPMEEAAAPATGGPGTFEVTYADGSVGTLVSAEDGTFTFTLGEETGTGTVTETDGKICFDPDAEDMETNCWTTGEVAEDGSWSSTSDDGEVVTVRRVEATAEAAAE